MNEMNDDFKLYRDMSVCKYDSRYPELGYNSKKLGVRIRGFTVSKDHKHVDIEADQHGNVIPNSEGMSVTPPLIKSNVNSVSLDRVVKGKTVMWEINASDLSSFGLKYRQDPHNPKHGFIEPANKMAATEFASLIKQTKECWRKSYDL